MGEGELYFTCTNGGAAKLGQIFRLKPGRGGPDKLSLADYDLLAAASGLTLIDRWSTWDREPFERGGDYAVSVHERRDAVG